MKKTLNINLGGMAFIIDENAFELLHQYLETLKTKFSNEAERKEIINDIESRIAEMFNQKLGNRKEVLSVEDIEYVIGVMGKPEDIAGEESTTEQSTTTTGATASIPSTPVKKKLFRDTEDSKIGGVIAGLCHYFGIEDPVWARIAAVILIFLTSGSIILVYLLLLVIIPKAETSAEKLQMKGEPINISTIEKEVKDSATRIGDSVSAVGSETFFQKLWHVVATVFKAILKGVAILVVIGAMAGLVGTLAWFLTVYVFGGTGLREASHLLVDSYSTISYIAVGALLFIAAPMVAFIYLGLKILLGQRSRVRWLKWALLGSWIAGIIMLTVGGVRAGLGFADHAVRKETVFLNQPAGNTLFVQLADSTDTGWQYAYDTDDEDFEVDERNVKVFIEGKHFKNEGTLSVGRPDIELTVSENDSFYIQKLVDSRGRNKSEALKNAGWVLYSYEQIDTVLNLGKHFKIAPREAKWRVQNVVLRIAVPEGKFVKFANNIDALSAIVKGDNNYDATLFANTTWTNEKGKIKCLDCVSSSQEEKDEEIRIKIETQRSEEEDGEKDNKDKSHEDY